MQTLNNVKFSNKDELLSHLRSYTDTPDDDVIRIKNKIKRLFLGRPDLLYALNDKKLEKELFNEDGTINTDGEWDRYFGDNSLIRPYIFIPDTQKDTNNYICYQVSADNTLNHNATEKYCVVTFVIFVNGLNRTDKLTGIARHDLLGSIIRDIVAWSDLTRSDAVPITNKEGITDNNYLTRTLIYKTPVPNDLTSTFDNITYYTNKNKIYR